MRLSSINQVASPRPQAHANTALNGVHSETSSIQWRASMLTGGPFVQGTRLPANPSAGSPVDLSRGARHVMDMQARPFGTAPGAPVLLTAGPRPRMGAHTFREGGSMRLLPGGVGILAVLALAGCSSGLNKPVHEVTATATDSLQHVTIKAHTYWYDPNRVVLKAGK